MALADDDTPTNLPPPTYTGPVQGNASIVIDAPLEKVWAAVIDFPSYPQWYVALCISQGEGLMANQSCSQEPVCVGFTTLRNRLGALNERQLSPNAGVARS